jgi:Uncharacterized low-complexity proteins
LSKRFTIGYPGKHAAAEPGQSAAPAKETVMKEDAAQSSKPGLNETLNETTARMGETAPAVHGSAKSLRDVLLHHRQWVGTGWELGERADLHGADLHASDLQGATLRDADLHDANLEGADLHDADLDGADLHGAKLAAACMHHALLHWADLHGADLHGADLRSADLRDTDLTGADLTDAALDGADIRGADLRDTCGFVDRMLAGTRLDADTRLPAMDERIVEDQ